jgi:hypothetical protein
MPSNKTVAVVVYTGKNSKYDVFISKCKEEKTREKKERERNSKMKQKKCRDINEWSEERVQETFFQLKKIASEIERLN